MSLIQVEHLSHTYGAGTPYAKEALTDVSLEIRAGETVGLIGHTGSGKSTLIQHLNGLLRPDAGRILFHGRDIWENPKEIRSLRFQVGIVFQYPEYQLFEDTVEKDIAFGPSNMGLPEEEIRRRVAAAAGLVGLAPSQLKASPFDLSGGEKRRAAIAGVLAMEPEVLVLDEPTAGLDPAGRELILSRIREYQQRTGATILMVSHSMEDMARMADRLLVMDHGRTVMFDDTRRIYRRSRELLDIGLDVPQVARIFLGLQARGLLQGDSAFTVEEALPILLKRLKGGGTTC